MAQGVLTEREWRKQAIHAPRRRPPCWGAQCMMPRNRYGLKQDRAFHALLIMLSFTVALILPFVVPRAQAPAEYQLMEAVVQPNMTVEPRTVSTVGYSAPEGLMYVARTFRHEELLRGKLLLIDTEHPLPSGVPAPNTMSIATYGKGMVPVTELTIKSGKETITALTRLFAALRGRGAGALTVCRGTMTPLEQREWRLQRLRMLSAQMPLNEATLRTLAETDAPGTGELQQEYTVDITIVGDGAQVAEQSVALKHTAWRYGFIPLQIGDSPIYRCRYVGEAHATAMTYLDLELKDYLELLHQKQVMHIKRDEDVNYLILCRPMNDGFVEFKYPENARWEVSLDNMGYAIMACTL